MDRLIDRRKALVTTLGVAGLGLGMLVGASGGVPAALAQDEAAPISSAAERDGLFSDEQRAQFYADFTAALGQELGGADAAAVDTAIRAALATVIDGFAGDDLLTAGQAEAVTSLLATVEVPVKPGPMFGRGPAMFMRGGDRSGGPGLPGEETIDVQVEEAIAGPRAMAERFYPEFTAALAAELGGSADEVDGAIRLAMISVIDTLDAETLPLPVSTDALKSMVAMAESPLSPGLHFGPPPGMVMHALHERHGDGEGFPGRGDDEAWAGRGADDERADEGEASGEDEDLTGVEGTPAVEEEDAA